MMLQEKNKVFDMKLKNLHEMLMNWRHGEPVKIKKQDNFIEKEDQNENTAESSP